MVNASKLLVAVGLVVLPGIAKADSFSLYSFGDNVVTPSGFLLTSNTPGPVLWWHEANNHQSPYGR
jgi:hypothetical protein